MKNLLGNNLRFLRKKNEWTLGEIPDNTGFSSSQWNNWELSLSFPKFLDFLEISKKFNVSETDLIHVDLQNAHLNENKKVLKNSENAHLNAQVNAHLNTQNVVNEEKELYNTPLAGNVYDLDTKAAAGVPALVQNTDMLHKQPTLLIPHLGPGIHIRMKISGDSMHATIKDGDYVIATYQPEPLKTLREGHIYLMIDKDDGVVCKRVYNSAKNTLELESDNDIYKPYHRKLTDILSLFKVVEVHTTDLRNYYSDTRREINKIWQEIAKLKRKN